MGWSKIKKKKKLNSEPLKNVFLTLYRKYRNHIYQIIPDNATAMCDILCIQLWLAVLFIPSLAFVGYLESDIISLLFWLLSISHCQTMHLTLASTGLHMWHLHQDEIFSSLIVNVKFLTVNRDHPTLFSVLTICFWDKSKWKIIH